MYPFPTPPLLRNISKYELDAARRCPFYIATRIRVLSYKAHCLLTHRIILRYYVTCIQQRKKSAKCNLKIIDAVNYRCGKL
jgi:hypothetical protein